jgi:hypothetical protein
VECIVMPVEAKSQGRATYPCQERNTRAAPANV